MRPSPIQATPPAATLARTQIAVTATTPTATTTPPLVPLEPTAAAALVQRLLLVNDYCAKPCIWGVVPGLTTLEEAKSLFAQLRNPLELGTADGSDTYYNVYFGKTFGLPDRSQVGIRIAAQGEEIRSIQLRVFPDPSKGRGEDAFWSAYGQGAVLARYGVPSSVEFNRVVGPSMGPEPTVHWVTTLYFQQWGLIAEYGTMLDSASRVHKDGAVTVCPSTDAVEDVSVWLGLPPLPSRPSGLRLEDASQLNPKQYRDEILKGQTCISLSAKSLFP